jgi:hypothetical protein
MDHQPVLVDQVVANQRLDELHRCPYLNVLARLVLSFATLLGTSHPSFLVEISAIAVVPAAEDG